MSTTNDRNDPRLTRGVDDQPAPQAEAYLIGDGRLPFVRPVRASYRHVDGCGAVTVMCVSIAETYARNPSFYGATYCTGCRMHRPVGAAGEFEWVPLPGETIPDEQRRVGT